jgi:D-glycero-D-manno-heptose 1,7-bisphosphate phosphatase
VAEIHRNHSLTRAAQNQEVIHPRSLESGFRAVFLDRDGVLVEAVMKEGKPYAPLSAETFVIVPGARECLEKLKAAGFPLICVTNQPEIARGNLSEGVLEEMHSALLASLALDSILVCPHDDPDGCDCRKPKPGLLLRAAGEFGIDLGASYLIGDRWRDVDAAHAAGVTAVLLDCGYNDRLPARVPEKVVRTLREAVDWILDRETRGLTA